MTFSTAHSIRAVPAISGLILLACFVAQTKSFAQAPYKAEIVPPQHSRYVKEHIIDAGDAPGHQLRIVEIEKTYSSDHPVIASVKITQVRQWAFTNYTNGVGPVIYFEIWSDDSGNSFSVEGSAETESQLTATGSKRGTSGSSARITGGKGKFATIQGILAGRTEFDSDPNNGYNRYKGRIEYWFRE